MRLFLIRHAQSANNALPEDMRVEDPGLTDIGEKQASALGDWIPQLELTHLVVSPFQRTLLTAEQIVRTTNLVPVVRTELHEAGGCYAGHDYSKVVGRPGMNRSEIAEQFPDWIISDSIDELGWWKSQPYETYEQVEDRARRLLAQTKQEFSDPAMRVAYVMHADFKMIFLQQFHPDPVGVPWNTSVTEVSFENGNPKVVRMNRTDHLRDDLVTR